MGQATICNATCRTEQKKITVFNVGQVLLFIGLILDASKPLIQVARLCNLLMVGRFNDAKCGTGKLPRDNDNCKIIIAAAITSVANEQNKTIKNK